MAAGQFHAAIRSFVAILELDMLPAIFEGGTFIVQADKEHLRPPAKAVTNVDRRRFAAGHRSLAAWADMDFVKIAAITGKHMVSSSLGKKIDEKR
jgi:hypothetical protein